MRDGEKYVGPTSLRVLVALQAGGAMTRAQVDAALNQATRHQRTHSLRRLGYAGLVDQVEPQSGPDRYVITLAGDDVVSAYREALKAAT